MSPGASARQVTVWDGVYTKQQASHGEILYRRVCERCHAPDLAGGKVVPEMVGGRFATRWSGRTVGDLFERVSASMPPEDPSGVARQDKADIVAFILSVNGFPPGDRVLPDRLDVLDRLAFAPAEP